MWMSVVLFVILHGACYTAYSMEIRRKYVYKYIKCWHACRGSLYYNRRN